MSNNNAPERLRVNALDDNAAGRLIERIANHVNTGILFPGSIRTGLEDKAQKHLPTLNADEATKAISLFLAEHTKRPGNDHVFDFLPIVQKFARSMGFPQDIILRKKFFADCEGQSVSACALWKVIKHKNPQLENSTMSVVTINPDGSEYFPHPDYVFFPVSYHSFNLLIGDRTDWRTWQPYDFLNYPPDFTDAVNTNEPGLLPFVIAQFGEQIGIKEPLKAAQECATELLNHCPVERFAKEAFEYKPFDGTGFRKHGLNSFGDYSQLESVMVAILYKNYDDREKAIDEMMSILPATMPDEVKLSFIMQSKPLQATPRLSSTLVNKSFQEPLTAKAISLLKTQLASGEPINRNVWNTTWVYVRDFLNSEENTKLKEFLTIDT